MSNVQRRCGRLLGAWALLITDETHLEGGASGGKGGARKSGGHLWATDNDRHGAKGCTGIVSNSQILLSAIALLTPVTEKDPGPPSFSYAAPGGRDGIQPRLPDLRTPARSSPLYPLPSLSV